MESFAVVAHSSGSGGWVVRSMFDGRLAQPYTDSQPMRVYKTRRGAEAFAEKLNGC